MVLTDDEELYKRCFAFHDQGHSPLRAWASSKASDPFSVSTFDTPSCKPRSCWLSSENSLIS